MLVLVVVSGLIAVSGAGSFFSFSRTTVEVEAPSFPGFQDLQICLMFALISLFCAVRILKSSSMVMPFFSVIESVRDILPFCFGTTENK